jgi:O-antigen/teichoic acid export membrane protein
MKTRSLSSRAAWVGAAKLTAFILSISLPLVVVRRLSQVEFGLYKQVFMVIGSANTLLPLGFAWNLMYFLPRERERRGAVIINVFLYNFTAGAIACLVLVLKPDLVAVLCGSPQLERYSALMGVVALLWITSSFLEIAALASQDLKRAGIFIVATQLSKTLLMVGAVWFIGTVKSLIVAAGIQAMFQFVVLWKYLSTRFPGFWREFDWKLMRTQISYSLPIGAAALLISMQTDLHSYFVSHRFGPSAFAIYAIGCFELPLIGILTESVSSVAMPQISLLQKEARHRDIIVLTANALRKLSAVYFPLYGLLMITGSQFIAFLFTSRYVSAWPIFAINLTVLPFCGLMLDPLCRGFAHVRFFVLWLRILVTVFLLVGLWFATMWFGMLGAITTVVIAVLAEKLVTATKMARVLGVKLDDLGLLHDVGKLAIASAIAAAVTAVLHSQLAGQKPLVVLAGCGTLFFVVYIVAVFLLGIPRVEERNVVLNVLSRARHSWQPQAATAPSAD